MSAAKKVVLTAMAALAVGLLMSLPTIIAGAATCDESTGSVVPAADGPIYDLPGESGWSSGVVHDKRTNCEYLVVTDGTSLAITPRLDADGRPMVTDQE